MNNGPETSAWTSHLPGESGNISSLRSVEALIDWFDIGVMLLRTDNTVIAVNRTAATILAMPQQASAGQRFTDLLSASEISGWVRAIRNMQPDRSDLVSLRIDGRTIVVVVSPGPEIDQAGSTYWVFIERQTFLSEVGLSYLTATYRLTGSELEIVQLLLAGLVPKRIATTRDVSVHTVRTQVRSILAKTHAPSVSDLILRISRLPPVGKHVLAGHTRALMV